MKLATSGRMPRFLTCLAFVYDVVIMDPLIDTRRVPRLCVIDQRNRTKSCSRKAVQKAAAPELRALWGRYEQTI